MGKAKSGVTQRVFFVEKAPCVTPAACSKTVPVLGVGRLWDRGRRGAGRVVVSCCGLVRSVQELRFELS